MYCFFLSCLLGELSYVCWWRGGYFLEDFFFFPKDQGQEESTPRVVGGKKNNKAHERLGSTTLLTPSVIISAWLGCLGDLHNAILTPSLQLSITTAVEVPSWSRPACSLSSLVSPLPSPICFFFSLSPHPLACRCLFLACLYVCLFLLGWARKRRRKDEFHIISVLGQVTDIW